MASIACSACDQAWRASLELLFPELIRRPDQVTLLLKPVCWMPCSEVQTEPLMTHHVLVLQEVHQRVCHTYGCDGVSGCHAKLPHRAALTAVLLELDYAQACCVDKDSVDAEGRTRRPGCSSRRGAVVSGPGSCVPSQYRDNA